MAFLSVGKATKFGGGGGSPSGPPGQFWPQADDFDHGATSFGNQLVGYLGLRVSAHRTGHLWRSSGGSPYAGAAVMATAWPDALACGVMRREVFTDAQHVRLTCGMAMFTGTPANRLMEYTAVVGRVQGGTLAAEGTVDVRLEAASCYQYRIRKVQSGPDLWRHELVRFDIGSPTVLATSDDAIPDSGILTSGHSIRLEVSDEGGDVRLRGFSTAGWTFVPSSGPIARDPDVFPPDPETLNLRLDFLDSSASKITGAGRCGFVVDREAGFGTDRRVARVDLFEVRDLDTGNALWIDTFQRAASQLGRPVTDFYGVVGPSLLSDYSGDQHAASGPEIFAQAATDQAEIRLGGTVVAWHQRPVQSIWNQKRSIWSTMQSNQNELDILLRGSPGATDASYIGYRLHLETGASAATIQIYRHHVPGSHPGILLAQQSAASPIGFAPATAIVATFEVRELVPGDHQSAAVLIATIESPAGSGPQQVQFELPGSPPPGVSIQSGVLFDGSGNRIVSGSATGWRGVSVNSNLLVDDWTRLAPGAGAPVASNSYPMDSETDGLTGDLASVLDPGWTINVELAANRRDDEMDAAVYQVRYLLDRGSRRVVTFNRRGVSDAEIAALRQFFDNHGTQIPFSFDLSAYVKYARAAAGWAFVEDSLGTGYGPGEGSENRTTSFRIVERF